MAHEPEAEREQGEQHRQHDTQRDARVYPGSARQPVTRGAQDHRQQRGGKEQQQHVEEIDGEPEQDQRDEGHTDRVAPRRHANPVHSARRSGHAAI
jgi:hypothetical protein